MYMVPAMPPSAEVVKDPKSSPDALKGLSPEEIAPGLRVVGLSGLLRKVRRNFQDYGWYITAHKALAYLLRAVYFRQVYRIYRIDVTAAKPLQEEETHPFTFKFLTTQNADMIAQIEDIAEWMRGKLTRQIATGQLCLVVLDGDRVAGFNLVNLSEATLPLVNLRKKLHHGFAWSEHVAVRKEYRKAGLGSQLRLRIIQELRRRGFRRLYGGTLASNVASLSLARSVGFTELADIHYHKNCGFERWRYKRVRG